MSETDQGAADAERLAVLAEVVSTYVDDQMGALASDARDLLIKAADSVDDRDEEDRLLSAMEEVEALLPPVNEAFRAELIGGLDPQGSLADDDGDRHAGAEDLALVETREVDDWVLLRRILLQQTKESRATEAALWERLAAVAGVAAEVDGSPVSVQGICLHFQAAMQDTGASRDARAAIYEAFERTVVGNLGALAVELGEALVAEIPPAAEAPADEGAEGEPAEGAPAGNPTAEGAAGAAEPREPESESQARPEAADEQARDAAQADEASAPGGGSGAEADAATTPEEGPGTTTSAGAADDPARVLGAMAGAQRDAPPPALRGAAELEAHLARAVGASDLALHEAGRRTLAAVAALTQQFLDHPDIETGVKRRLRRLAPPLLLLALRDDDHLRLELEAARHDPVTGLLDGASFDTRLAAALRDGARPPALCLIEIDNFGAIVERFGHQVAGRMLRGLVDLLHKHAGGSATSARLRTAELAVLLPAGRAGSGRRLAQRLLVALSSARFALKGEEVELRASIGVVEPDDAPGDAGALMEAAYTARTAARQAGGACLRVHGR